jgi:hypothetical protein
VSSVEGQGRLAELRQGEKRVPRGGQSVMGSGSGQGEEEVCAARVEGRPPSWDVEV